MLNSMKETPQFLLFLAEWNGDLTFLTVSPHEQFRDPVKRSTPLNIRIEKAAIIIGLIL